MEVVQPDELNYQSVGAQFPNVFCSSKNAYILRHTKDSNISTTEEKSTGTSMESSYHSSRGQNLKNMMVML